MKDLTGAVPRVVWSWKSTQTVPICGSGFGLRVVGMSVYRLIMSSVGLREKFIFRRLSRKYNVRLKAFVHNGLGDRILWPTVLVAILISELL